MWSTSSRPDSAEPGDAEMGLALASAYEAGDAIDTACSALRCADDYGDLDPYVLAACRTDADAEHLTAAFEASLVTPAEPAEVVDLAARRRRATPHPERGRLRAA